MNKVAKVVTLTALVASLAACSRVETGQVGIVRQFDKEIDVTERMPGTFTQTITQDMFHAQTKDISVDVTDLRPLASDNSTVQDFDVQVIYSINPTSAAELYREKAGPFHSVTSNGDMLLMYNYVFNVARNAAYKVARNYKSLELSDNRNKMETDMLTIMNDNLNTEEGLKGAIVVQQVLIRNIQPATSIVESANEFIRSQNELKKKEVELQTAKVEAERIKALSQNQDAIEYMRAQAELMIAEGVRSGKVNTIVVPRDFKGIVNTK